MFLDYKSKQIKKLNKKQAYKMKKIARLALRDIELRYDLGHKSSFKVAIEGGVNVSSIEKALRNLLKADDSNPFYYSNSINLATLLHYNGDSKAINNLIEHFGIYFSEFVKSNNIGNNIDTSNLDYFLQLKVKKMESMGINPEILIHKGSNSY